MPADPTRARRFAALPALRTRFIDARERVSGVERTSVGQPSNAYAGLEPRDGAGADARDAVSRGGTGERAADTDCEATTLRRSGKMGRPGGLREEE